MRIIGKPSKGKVRNATKIEADGIKFDSKLEYYFYSQLKKLGVKFDLKIKYTLLEGFRYNGKAILPMTLTPDFFLTDYNIIVDTKGYGTEESKLKFKLLKKLLLDTKRNYRVYILKNQKECNQFLKDLLENNL